jgi:branched-chain amino acid transport system permease protein
MDFTGKSAARGLGNSLVVLRELLRPLGQIVSCVLASSLVLSLLMLAIAYALSDSAVDQACVKRLGINLFSFTLANLPQVLVDGMTIGFVYATIALGYTMVYGVLEFINFAHSEIFAIGAFVGVEILIALSGAKYLTGISALAACGYLALAMLAAMVAAGFTAVAVEVIAYRPLRRAPRLVPLISAIGVSFFLQDLIRLVESLTTGQFHRIIPTFGNFDQRLSLASLSLLDVKMDISIQVKSIVVIVAAVCMLVGLNYLVNATRMGKAIRSVAQDQQSASLMGININRYISLTFLIGGALGGAAGVLYALKFTRIDPFVGFFPGLKAFTAAVLGGIGNLPGALLGGIVLGMLETFAGAYLSTFTMGAAGAEYKDILAFAILILVLVFRPSGLLGEQVGQKA